LAALIATSLKPPPTRASRRKCVNFKSEDCFDRQVTCWPTTAKRLASSKRSHSLIFSWAHAEIARNIAFPAYVSRRTPLRFVACDSQLLPLPNCQRTTRHTSFDAQRVDQILDAGVSGRIQEFVAGLSRRSKRIVEFESVLERIDCRYFIAKGLRPLLNFRLSGSSAPARRVSEGCGRSPQCAVRDKSPAGCARIPRLRVGLVHHPKADENILTPVHFFTSFLY